MLNGEDLRRRPYVERKAAHQHIRCVWIHCQPREQVKRKSRSGGPLRLFFGIRLGGARIGTRPINYTPP
jgi:hypothetical protein